MSILGLLISLVIVGVILWAVNALIPMQPQIKTILNVVVVILTLIWLANLFGAFGGMWAGPVVAPGRVYVR
jgi:uncharacterized membrane protein